MKLAVLVSGRGINLEYLMREARQDYFPAIIDCVISNNDEAGALNIANQGGIKTFIVQKKNLGSLEACDTEIDKILTIRKIDYVCLAGFMRILGPNLVNKWKMLNIHPSLLPSFPGINAAEQALTSGVRISGCTVHFVDDKVDNGPIIAQAAVPVFPDDNVDSLSDRIIKTEVICYPYAIMKVMGVSKEILQKKIEEAWCSRVILV